MNNIACFKTIKNCSEIELIEKKSRFIASASPVETLEEAQVFIDNLKKKHYNATHNCFAYKIGLDGALTRCSDDGEPSGTAGTPILNVIEGEGLKNIVIVVTRYFGGTLLGTGGLIRAYGGAAKQAAVSAGIIEKKSFSVVKVAVEYGLSGKLQYETLGQGHHIFDTVYTDNVEYTIWVEERLTKQFIDAVTELSNGTAIIRVQNTIFSELP